jgi:hypothetical protein
MTAPHKPSAAFDYDYEERAAILEFEAGYPRDEAERRAREMQESLAKMESLQRGTPHD